MTFKPILGALDSILGIRQNISADLHKVFIVSREWTGDQVGDGEYYESEIEILPTPGLRDFAHDVRINDGGQIKASDFIVTNISKNQFPVETDVDASGSSARIEKLYRIGDYYYRVISVVEKQATWHVQVRYLADQTKDQGVGSDG